jgi:capsular polysaccharide biosynthesis protein
MTAAVTAYIDVLRTRWRWTLWGVLIVLAVTTLFLVLAPRMYRTHAVVFVRTPGDVSRVLDGGDTYANGRAKTYAALAGSTSVSERVIADLRLDLDPQTLSERIKAANPPGTALINITVDAPTAADVQRIANVFLSEYEKTVRALELVPGSLVPRAELVVVDPPSQPSRVVEWGVPTPVVLLGAALIGLVLGATAAVLRSILERSARDRADAAKSTGTDRHISADSGPASRTEREGEGLTTKAFVAAIRRYRLTFLLVTGAVFVVGVTSILLSPNKFVSSTRLMVSIEGSTTAAAYEDEQVAARRVSSYIPLLTSGVVTQRVIDRLRLPMTASELADKIDATNVPPKTSLIDVEVTDESPDRARRIADTLATEFIVYATAMETPTGEDSQKVHTTVVSPATEGRQSPFESVLLGVLAAIAALLLGAVAVWIRSAREHAKPRAGQDTVGGDTPATETTAPAPAETVEATDHT